MPSEIRIDLDLRQVRILPFSKDLPVRTFDCGVNVPNHFIKKVARKAQDRLEYKVFVAVQMDQASCLGYYALQLGSDSVELLSRDKKDNYVHNKATFPSVNLSFLGVHKAYQRQGLGELLIQDAMSRVAQISQHAGFFAFTVESIDERSSCFYMKQGFTEYSEGSQHPKKFLYPIESVLRDAIY